MTPRAAAVGAKCQALAGREMVRLPTRCDDVAQKVKDENRTCGKLVQVSMMIVSLSFSGYTRQGLGAIALVKCSEHPVMDPRNDEPPPRASVTEGTTSCGCIAYWPFLFDLWQSSKAAKKGYWEL